MRTRNPISTISYNSDEFLVRHLSKLVDCHELQFWAYMHHAAEDTERRDHKHLFLLPDGLIDTSKLSDELMELHSDGSVDSCKLWRPSRWGDWYYYALHDPAYLACHYELDKPKKYRYIPESLVCSDSDIRQALNETINFSELLSPSLALVRDHAEAGIGIKDFLRLFPVKKSEIRYIKEIYDLYFKEAANGTEHEDLPRLQAQGMD